MSVPVMKLSRAVFLVFMPCDRKGWGCLRRFLRECTFLFHDEVTTEAHVCHHIDPTPVVRTYFPTRFPMVPLPLGIVVVVAPSTAV